MLRISTFLFAALILLSVVLSETNAGGIGCGVCKLFVRGAENNVVNNAEFRVSRYSS